MAVLVVLLAVVIALLALLVAGLLRSHAEILRALHELGVDMDPARADGVDTPVAAPTTRTGDAPGSPTVRRAEVAARPPRSAADVSGKGPDQSSVSISVQGAGRLTLLAFLTTGCSTCHFFWDAFAEPGLEVPGDARLVVVTKGTESESIGMVRKLAPERVPTVLSTEAWEAYDVPVAPFFVLIDGASASVIGEGAASTWEQVTSLLHNALDDAGMLDKKGKVKSGVRPRLGAGLLREQRVDEELLAAGIRPGDPSLYVLPEQEAPVPPAEERDR